MALIECIECGKQISDKSDSCPHCGVPMKALRAKPHKEWHKRTSVTLSLAGVLIVVALGFIHIITGVTSVLGLPFDITQKNSFGYSETFVNADKVTNMPWISAKSKYPLGCKVLQRKGYVESDAVFEKRVREETEKEMEEIQHQIEQEQEKALKQYEKALLELQDQF